MSLQPDPERGSHPHLAAVPDPTEPEDWTAPSCSLFDGDQGQLEQDQRKALVAIVKQRFISAETHPAEWKALTADADAIRSRLNDLFLTLHLDTEREVAWKRQAKPEGGGDFPTLLYDAAWNREATIALVFARSRQRAEALAGNDTAYVDREEILGYIESLRPASATDQVGDAKRAAKAIDDLYSAGLLRGRKTGDRFQIARAIEALMPLSELQRLHAALEQHTAPVPDPAGDDTEPDPSAGTEPAMQETP